MVDSQAPELTPSGDESKNEKSSAVELRFSCFSVYVTYGFSLVPHRDAEDEKKKAAKRVHDAIDDWIKKNTKHALLRPGWSPIYRPGVDMEETFPVHMQDISRTELRGDKEPAKITICAPIRWEVLQQNNPYSEKLEVSVEYSATFRKDGYGALTIELHVPPKGENNEWMLGDVITTLLLAPRTIGNSQQNPIASSINWDDEDNDPRLHSIRNRCITSGAINPGKHSSAYQLFSIGLFLVSKELCLPPDTVFPSADQNRKDSSEHYLDPQLPYFYILGDVAGLKKSDGITTFEQEYFFQRKKEREEPPPERYENAQISQQIAAILYRWNIPHNIHYVSREYLNEQERKNSGCFQNHYVNQLVYMTFTSCAALSLTPDANELLSKEKEKLKKEEKGRRFVYEKTQGTLLRAIEFSRIRWEHAVRINQALDEFARELRKKRDPAENMLELVKRIIELRAEAAIFLEDPMVLLWDETIGSEIADVLQKTVIEPMGSNALKKIDLLSALLRDQETLMLADDWSPPKGEDKMFDHQIRSNAVGWRKISRYARDGYAGFLAALEMTINGSVLIRSLSLYE